MMPAATAMAEKADGKAALYKQLEAGKISTVDLTGSATMRESLKDARLCTSCLHTTFSQPTWLRNVARLKTVTITSCMDVSLPALWAAFHQALKQSLNHGVWKTDSSTPPRRVLRS